MSSLNELQKGMLRTAHLDEPRNRALSLCALGLSGEAGEVADLIKKYFYHGKPFDRAKLLEEAGDVAWYMAYLCHTLNFEFNSLRPKLVYFHAIYLRNLNDAELFSRIGMQLTHRAGAIASYLEDMIFNQQTRDEAVKRELVILFDWLDVLASYLGDNFEGLCELNIAKLNKRYPNGFNTADSIARRDEQPA